MEVLRALLALAFSAIIAAWFIRHVFRALATGLVNVHNVIVRRRGRPAYYWFAVTVQAGFGALFVFSAVVNALKLVS